MKFRVFLAGIILLATDFCAPAQAERGPVLYSHEFSQSDQRETAKSYSEWKLALSTQERAVLFGHAPVASGGGGNDPATTAWIAQVISRGGTVSGTQTTRVNNLIVCLKTGATNLFAISDIFLLMAAENTQQAETDLITPSRTQATTTTTFNAVGGTAPFGPTPDGTTTFFDTNWVPSSGANCTVNSCTQLLYDGSTVFSGRLGVFDGTGTTLGLRFLGTTSIDFYLNAVSGSGQPVTNVKSIFIGVRTLAAATQVYQNGSSVGTGTDASAGVPTTFTYWASGGQNAIGAYSSGSTDVIGAFAALSQLNSTQVTQLNGCLQTYLTAWGA